MLMKLNRLSYMASGSVNPNRRVTLHFQPIFRVWVLSNVVEDRQFQQLLRLHVGMYVWFI